MFNNRRDIPADTIIIVPSPAATTETRNANASAVEAKRGSKPHQ